jgi:hypothetical protein
MERFQSVPRVRAVFSHIDVDMEIEFVEDGDDHECAKVGMKGTVVAKHVGVVNGRFFIRLHCGHGCVCSAVRSQIKPTGWDEQLWN